MPDTSEEDRKQLVSDDFRAGIFCYMGSGSKVDLVVNKPKNNVSDVLQDSRRPAVPLQHQGET